MAKVRELPEYEVNWTPADCTHAVARQGMRHLHPQDCFAFELADMRARNARHERALRYINDLPWYDTAKSLRAAQEAARGALL